MAGDGYVILGDAFAFIDPVFSSGVFFAMNSALLGAETVDGALRHPERRRVYEARFERSVRRGLSSFSWFIYRITTPALREMFARMFREGRDYHWQMDVVVESPAAAAAEWTFSYVVTEAVPRSAGRKIRFTGMSVFELADGRIARYREYFDTGVALLQLGFAPDGLAKVLRRRL